MKDALTQADQLVLAVADLEGPKRKPVPMHLLIVAVWKMDRGRWGLGGYEALYPHSNRVVAAMSVRAGPVRKGWLMRPWPGVSSFVLTDAGRERLAELRQRKEVA